MKLTVIAYGCIGVLMLGGAPLEAQNAPPLNAKPQIATPIQAATPAEIAVSDLSVTANVSARELRFDQVGQMKVEFFGAPQRKTLWEEDHQNIARPARPGITYRDIGSQLRVSSRFEEIERIVAQALGQIASEKAPRASNVPSIARTGTSFPAFPAPVPPLPVEAAPIPAPKAVLPVKPLPTRGFSGR